MGKLYVRVDDRLIHGQTIVAWCPTLGIQEIIAVDDVSAANPMLKSILTMGVPKNYKTGIVTTQEAKKLLGEGSDKTRLLIVKFPQKLEELRQEILGCEKLILGNLAKRPDTVHKVSSTSATRTWKFWTVWRKAAWRWFSTSCRPLPRPPGRISRQPCNPTI